MAVKGWKEFMERVKNKGVIKKFKKGETILREGSRGFNFYFILLLKTNFLPQALITMI